jgi:hypothetical protein
MKTIKMNAVWLEMLVNMTAGDIANARAGSCNLVAGYLNNYTSDAINEFVGDFLESARNIELPLAYSDYIGHPDYILQHATSEFYGMLEGLGIREEYFNTIKIGRPAGDKIFIFGRPFSNNSSSYWIIRAGDEYDAVAELCCEFEDDFIVETVGPEDTAFSEDSDCYYINDNGNPCDIDGLVLIAEIVGE